ncbi:FAD-dependent oxidoreductase [Pseudooceanicola sp. GBMRC 2024]|uniref:FAD-dependent oxidoreductase n=1 Tax=Pseudooceanicola albus TaxID=2692189 RepID=A0A6L7G248_9RHOB|nr:FAD-dependent oxidoreductase [Pseudooceanicola albus]MXN17969.1 FAD-dependent oxidoreductase [Pseudooceanicola albus]
MFENPKSWDVEADVVVVGYGFAGATAAITAHDAGAKVVLLEKAPEEFKGGNSRVSANLVFWPNDIAKAKAYFRALAGPYMDDISDEMVDVWAEEMFANRAWLEGLGLDPVEYDLVEFPELPGSDCAKTLMHGQGNVGEERMWKLLVAAVEARGIETLYGTGAQHLLREDGVITGLVATRDGEELMIRARRGVALTCGGFEANPEMIRDYLYGLPDCFPLGTPYNTGDGIRMGTEIGADLWHMNNVSGPLISFKAPDVPTCLWLNLPHANSMIIVGADGQRFNKEARFCVDSDRHGKVLRHGMWKQQDLPMPMYMIFDESFRTAGSLGHTTDSWEHLTGTRYQWSEDNSAEVEKGWILKADSIAALAGLIGQDPEVLEATVARFNAGAEQGEDPDWGRAADRVAPIVNGPFYAMPLTPGFVNTQGGPRRDQAARVLDTEKAPIPRLYSAGELGSIYSFLYQGGGNIGECFAFGRIAGRNAAAETPLA